MGTNVGYERIIKLLQESTFGTTPSSALEKFKVKSGKMRRDPVNVPNEELHDDGNERQHDEAGEQCSGSYNFNLRFCDVMHDILQHTMRASAWTSASITETDIAFNATNNSLSSTATNFINTFTIGLVVKISGATESANSGYGMITALTANEMTLSSNWIDFDDEAEGDSVTVECDYVRNGSTSKSFSVEDEYTRITQFENCVGMTVDSLTLEIASRAVAEGTVNFQGKTFTPAQATIGTGTDVAASSSKAFVAGSGVEKFFIDNSSTGVCDVRIGLSYANNLIPDHPVTEQYPSGMDLGMFNHMINADLYFEDETFVDYYMNQTSIEVSTVLKDADGNYYIFTAFNGVLDDAVSSDPGPTGAVQMNGNIHCYYDSDRDCTCQIIKIAA